MAAGQAIQKRGDFGILAASLVRTVRLRQNPGSAQDGRGFVFATRITAFHARLFQNDAMNDLAELSALPRESLLARICELEDMLSTARDRERAARAVADAATAELRAIRQVVRESAATDRV